MPKLNSSKDMQRFRKELAATHKQKPTSITVCAGTACIASGGTELMSAFNDEVGKLKLQDVIDVCPSGCHGFCERGPIVLIMPEKICYLKVQVKDVLEIIEKTVIKNEIISRLVYADQQSGKGAPHIDDIPFYKYQHRILLANNALIDASDILSYFAVDGYSALAKALDKMGPEDIIKTIKEADLRGRGGGGFPAGVKWETTRNAPGDIKYVIVNADEGDPGAYMDRSVLEGNPHSVIEGLIIGAYAIGAHDGFIYVREEYPLALKNTETALRQAREYGLLGNNILGSGFSFDIKIHRGAGAFVSGESSALMSAIEGNVGEPRSKYIRTSVKGIWDRPSCLNNVETWANVPFIINKGVEWFRSIGTEGSKGTKIFSLVGKINNSGLVEVPMGTSIRKIIFDIGGGIPNNKKFKAVQTGGPSGGVLPESMLDLPVDFDRLTKEGSMMGSGGMIVMDEDTCMVDTARYYIEFLAHESCGKCVPCREGLRQMLKILNDITAGRGKDGDIELLEELSDFMKDASLCALGQSAPFPVLSTIRHFRNEYEAHIKEKRCPSAVCKELIEYKIDPDLCGGCGLCSKNCPEKAIDEVAKKTFVINSKKCIKCAICISVCPDKFNAIKKISG